jgi:sugar (pentulose or hexulose) kinase
VKLVLAIDQGTTGTTALLIDAKGGVRARPKRWRDAEYARWNRAVTGVLAT